MKRNALALALVLVLLGSLTIGVLAQEQVEVVARVKPLIQVDGLLFKDLNANGELDPYEDWRLPVDERVENLVSLMTLEEKAGAMFHPKLPVPLDGSIDTKPVDLTLKGDIMYDPYTYIHDLKIINLLNNGVAPPATFARWSNDIQEIAESTRLGIPIMFSTDPRHGAVLGAHVKGNQYFSQWPSREGQLGLAATRNIDLVREFGRVVAEEYRAVGLHMILGPQIDLVTEPRWGRNAGCWSESAELTAEMTVAFLEGLGVKDPKNGALAMVKHWPGAGPHEKGFQNPRVESFLVYPGDNLEYHLLPFRAAFEAGATATMPYYSFMEGETYPLSYSQYAIQELLREHLGFDGVACTDWGVTDWAAAGDARDLTMKERFEMCINAGIDQFGMPTNEGISDWAWERRVRPDLIVDLVHEGRISEERVNESVKRILRQTFMLGLFENPYVDPARAEQIVQSPENQALGYQAQLESIIMLTNNGALPFSEATLEQVSNEYVARRTKVFVLGIDEKTARNYAEVVDDPTLADVAVVRVSVGRGGFPEEAMDMIKAIADTGVPTAVVMNLGSPVVIPQELFDIAAGTFTVFDVLDAPVLDVVFGRFNPVGKLPYQLPSTTESIENQLEDVPFDLEDPLFDFGHGLSY